MALSEFALKSAKSREKPYRLADGDGLHLLVQPNGTKLWQLRYRFLEKEDILSFGKYPAVTLADARRKRDNAKRLLADGTDPAEQRRQDKIAAVTAARTTFGLIAKEFIERMEKSGAAEATLAKKRWLLEDLASPLSNRPIKAITPAEILDFLRRIEKSGRRETARRLRGVIGSVFRLAIVTLRADADPTLALRGALLAPKVRGHSTITDEKEFGSLLAAIDEYHGWPTLQLALKFLALTCVRPGEVRGALQGEFDCRPHENASPARRAPLASGPRRPRRGVAAVGAFGPGLSFDPVAEATAFRGRHERRPAAYGLHERGHDGARISLIFQLDYERTRL